MPKLGMKRKRKEALVAAAIAEIGAKASLDVTVGAIARRAGVSSALAHHYFGGKSDILLAAMRSILRDYGQGVRRALRRAEGPRARLEAVIGAGFAAPNYRAEVVTAWLAFYLAAESDPGARRILDIYHRRLRSTLVSDLRRLMPETGTALDAAETLGALIDGIYIRTALSGAAPDGRRARERVVAVLDRMLEAGR